MKLTKSDWKAARTGISGRVSMKDKYAKLANENGITWKCYEARVRRGMDPLEAANKPVLFRRVFRGGDSVMEAAERHGVHWQSIYNWRKAHKDISANMTADEMAQRVAENAKRARARRKPLRQAGAKP